jgi:hypothetical protein
MTQRGRDADHEEQTVLDVMCGATRLWGDLCAELQEEANVRAVAQATQVEVLHTDGALGFAPVTKDMLDEVNDEEGASGIIDE